MRCSQRIRDRFDDALYKSTLYLLTYLLTATYYAAIRCPRYRKAGLFVLPFNSRSQEFVTIAVCSQLYLLGHYLTDFIGLSQSVSQSFIQSKHVF